MRPSPRLPHEVGVWLRQDDRVTDGGFKALRISGLDRVEEGPVGFAGVEQATHAVVSKVDESESERCSLDAFDQIITPSVGIDSSAKSRTISAADASVSRSAAMARQTKWNTVRDLNCERQHRVEHRPITVREIEGCPLGPISPLGWSRGEPSTRLRRSPARQNVEQLASAHVVAPATTTGGATPALLAPHQSGRPPEHRQVNELDFADPVRPVADTRSRSCRAT